MSCGDSAESHSDLRRCVPSLPVASPSFLDLSPPMDTQPARSAPAAATPTEGRCKTRHMAGGWDSEGQAVDLMRSYLGGTPVVRDPGGGATQMHDFDLVLAEGRTFAVEVTRFNVPDQLKTWAEVGKRTWQCPNLRYLWLVTFVTGRSVQEAHRQLPGVLEGLEQRAVERLDIREVLSPVPNDPWDEEPAAPRPTADAEALWSLGVLRVCNLGHGEDGIGAILMNEPPAIGATSADSASLVATKMAWLPDNLAKLRAAEAPERHLFVWVESSQHQVVAAINGDWLPETAPDLPDEVDAVWLATAFEPSHVWRWSRSAGWEDLGAWRPEPA